MTLQQGGAGQSPGNSLVTVGHVTANEHWIVTPAGTWPIAEVNVSSTDQTATTTHTPAWAIILVILFIWFFLLSLLFLLARETRVSGFVSIHVVAANGQSYSEQVPVFSAGQRLDIVNRVTYLQGLIGAARAAAR
ncbi:MAG: hypothetical protein QM675_03745 [Protaetiibacter sp.]